MYNAVAHHPLTCQTPVPKQIRPPCPFQVAPPGLYTWHDVLQCGMTFGQFESPVPDILPASSVFCVFRQWQSTRQGKISLT